MNCRSEHKCSKEFYKQKRKRLFACWDCIIIIKREHIVQKMMIESFIFRNKVRKINWAVKIRIYPNAEQRVQIEKTIGCSRFIYNCMLADKMEHYKKEKKMLRNTPASYKKEYPWLKEVDSLALANVQMHLESAFHKFFREPSAGFPRFKSKNQQENLIQQT